MDFFLAVCDAGRLQASLADLGFLRQRAYHTDAFYYRHSRARANNSGTNKCLAHGEIGFHAGSCSPRRISSRRMTLRSTIYTVVHLKVRYEDQVLSGVNQKFHVLCEANRNEMTSPMTHSTGNKRSSPANCRRPLAPIPCKLP